MAARDAFQQISTALNAAIIDQETVIERLLIAFLADGHVLMTGEGFLQSGYAFRWSGLVIDVDLAVCVSEEVASW